MNGQPLTYYDEIRWMQARNVGAGTIPSFGLCQIVTTDADGTLQVQLPTADSLDTMVNGMMQMLAGAGGIVTRNDPVLVQYDPSDGTPAPGQFWGSGTGSGLLRSNNNQVGWLIDGMPYNGLVMAQRWLPNPVAWCVVFSDAQGAYGYPGAVVGSYSPATQEFLSASVTATTVSASISAGVRTVTPASMTGITVGAAILVYTCAGAEFVTVTSKTGSTFTATFTGSYTGPVNVVIGGVWVDFPNGFVPVPSALPYTGTPGQYYLTTLEATAADGGPVYVDELPFAASATSTESDTVVGFPATNITCDVFRFGNNGSTPDVAGVPIYLQPVWHSTHNAPISSSTILRWTHIGVVAPTTDIRDSYSPSGLGMDALGSAADTIYVPSYAAFHAGSGVSFLVIAVTRKYRKTRADCRRVYLQRQAITTFPNQNY